MRKRYLLLLAAVLLALPLGASIATADPGENNKGPEGKPCNADHDHSQAKNKNKKCQEGPPGDESCSDGVDNDNDGLTDADDPDCQQEPGTEGPPGDPNCSDGVDNDEDGLTDADDPDCQQEPGTEGPPGDPNCSDGVDNDEDGLTDADDPDCQEADSNRCHAPNSLSAALDLPPGDHFDTVAHELFAAGLDVGPLTEHPDADGPVTAQIWDGFDAQAPSPIKEIGKEVACAGDFAIDSEELDADL